MKTRRIVSLVPSLSASLVDLGLRTELVGCTQFCVEPADLHRQCTLIGGTKDIDLATIRALAPTHILANQEENPRDAVLALAEQCPTHVSFPRGPEDVPAMLRDIGAFLGCQEAAEPWALQIERALARLREGAKDRGRYLYFIWRDPYMVVGPDTYIARLLASGAWRNAYEGPERYPVMSLEEIKSLHPDRLLLSSEPYPFRKRDAARLREAWPEVPEILKVDGRLLSWHGTTTLQAIQWLEQAPSFGSSQL